MRWSLFFVAVALLVAAPIPPLPAAEAGHPSTEGLTGEVLFQKVLEHNQRREKRLEGYEGVRTYRITKADGKVRAETRVRVRYRAPDAKEFEILSEQGSGFVRRRVFKPLMEGEAESAAGRSRRDSSITPANYRFELLGEEDVGGRHSYRVRAIPVREDKYLFEGTVTIDATDFAIVRVEGRPAKNPSFWTKRVDFVREYQKVGGFWLQRQDESVTEVRIFGTHVLRIEYEDYRIAPGGGGRMTVPALAVAEPGRD